MSLLLLSIHLIDLDLENLILVILSPLLHILIKERSHVDFTAQELLLGILSLVVRRASFLVNT